MKAFASLLTSKKKQTLGTQPDALVQDQPRTSLPLPARETLTGHPKNHGTRTASVSAAPLLTRDRVPFQHHRDQQSPSPSQPRQDAHIPSGYLTPPAFPLILSTKGPPKPGKSKPYFFLAPRLNKPVTHVEVEALQRSSWMLNDSDPFAGPSSSVPQRPTAEDLFSVPPPPQHEPDVPSPPSLKSRDGPGTNDVVLASDLYQRRRARSVGPSGAPLPDFLVQHVTLPPIPSVIPLRITKDAPPGPKQLPTPSTPSAPTSFGVHSRVLSDGSTRSMTHKKSLPCIEGVWNDFLKEVEEDIESLTAGRSEKELPPPPPPPKNSPPKRPLPLPTCRPRSKTLGSSTIIEKGLPSPGPLTPRRNCFPPMPIIVTHSISKEEVDSSPLPPPGMAPQSKPTSVLDTRESQSISMLPYLGSESSMTTGSDLSLSLFPSPPSVPIRRPTDAKGILRTQLTQPPPSRPIPPTPNSPASTIVSQGVDTVLFTSSNLPLTPEIRLPVFSNIINYSNEKPAEMSSTVALSRPNSTDSHAPTNRPRALTLGRTLHVPAPSTSSTPSLRHSPHSHHSSTSSCTSVATDYSSLLYQLEDPRISVVSNTSSQYAHADPFVVPPTVTGPRMTIIDKSVYGHTRADALGGLKMLKYAAGLTDLNRPALTSPAPMTESVELLSESKSCGDTFEWGYAL